MPKPAPALPRQPRHRAIYEALRADILAGRHPIGSLLPTEQSLQALHGVSRQTVRVALQALTQEGFVARRPRVGTTVVATRPTTVLTQEVESIEELLAYPAGSYRTPVDSRFIQADPETAGLIKCDAGAEWFRISMLRFAGEGTLPICWTDMYVVPPYAGVVRHPRHLLVPVCIQITEMFQEALERASVEIFAGRVPQRMAARLQVETGTPALYVLRRYRGRSGRPFEISVSVHPEKRFRVTMELQRELRVRRRSGRSAA